MGNPSSVRKRRFIAGGSVRFVLRRDDDEPNDEQDHQKRHKQDHSNRDHSNRHLIASFRVVNGLLRGSSGRWEWGNVHRYCLPFMNQLCTASLFQARLPISEL